MFFVLKPGLKVVRILSFETPSRYIEVGRFWRDGQYWAQEIIEFVSGGQDFVRTTEVAPDDVVGYFGDEEVWESACHNDNQPEQPFDPDVIGEYFYDSADVERIAEAVLGHRR